MKLKSICYKSFARGLFEYIFKQTFTSCVKALSLFRSPEMFYKLRTEHAFVWSLRPKFSKPLSDFFLCFGFFFDTMS